MEEQRKSSLKCMSSVDEQGSFKVHIFFERAPLSTDEQIRPWKSTFPLGEHVSLEKKRARSLNERSLLRRSMSLYRQAKKVFLWTSNVLSDEEKKNLQKFSCGGACLCDPRTERTRSVCGTSTSPLGESVFLWKRQACSFGTSNVSPRKKAGPPFGRVHGAQIQRAV